MQPVQTHKYLQSVGIDRSELCTDFSIDSHVPWEQKAAKYLIIWLTSSSYTFYCKKYMNFQRFLRGTVEERRARSLEFAGTGPGRGKTLLRAMLLQVDSWTDKTAGTPSIGVSRGKQLVLLAANNISSLKGRKYPTSRTMRFHPTQVARNMHSMWCLW